MLIVGMLLSGSVIFGKSILSSISELRRRGKGLQEFTFICSYPFVSAVSFVILS